MIDNYLKIKELLNFEEEGDFYMLLVLKRKKDQPEEERENHQSVRTIKTYCIESIEDLDKRYDEIKNLCSIFNARAYIHVSRQNHKDVGLLMIEALAERIRNGVIRHKHIFDSVVGQVKIRDKRWIVDIDDPQDGQIDDIIICINSLQPIDEDKIIAQIPTKNGIHLITKPFNKSEFHKIHENIDIHKTNPTLLFCPDQ